MRGRISYFQCETIVLFQRQVLQENKIERTQNQTHFLGANNVLVSLLIGLSKYIYSQKIEIMYLTKGP